MAKKQGKPTGGVVDIKALNTKLSAEREKVIKYGISKGFNIRYARGMFILVDKEGDNTPIAILPHKEGEPEDYGKYVITYINKVRDK